MRDAEFGEQFVQHDLARVVIGLDHFEHGADIVLDRKPAEDRGFLRQIAEAEPRAAIHRERRDIHAVEQDAAGIGLHEAGHQIKTCRFAGAVGAEKPDHFAALQRRS